MPASVLGDAIFDAVRYLCGLLAHLQMQIYQKMLA